jgi:hypothetical protein
MFWSENTERPAYVYGIGWKKGMLDINVERFYLLLMGAGEILKDKIRSTQQFINYFDLAQGFTPSIVHETQDDRNIVIEFSKEWTTNGALLSAFTTIIRISSPYILDEGAEDFINRVYEKLNTHTIAPGEFGRSYVDICRLSVTRPRLFALLSGMKVDMKWSDSSSGMNAHTNGIYGYHRFPSVDKVCVEKKPAIKPVKIRSKALAVGSKVTGTINNQEFSGIITRILPTRRRTGYIEVTLSNDEGILWVYLKDITKVLN